MSNDLTPRVVISSGEPAGIGPELLIKLATHPINLRLACIGDPELLSDVARILNLDLDIRLIRLSSEIPQHEPGTLSVFPCKLNHTAIPGLLDKRNAAYVLKCLDTAIDLCTGGFADALTTAPLQKSILNEAGITFSGHTEYLAEKTGSRHHPVMLLASENLRIALATTHLSLRQVPDKISREHISTTIEIVAQALSDFFGIKRPKIAVCGLNPHAGENGHFGREEIEIIEPAVADAQQKNILADGPLPADTAFTPDNRAKYDCFISMFHDQGLPVIKALEFGEIVNVTLGLPIIRTSVDHGTALDIAGRGVADPASLITAVDLAAQLARRNTI